MAAVAEAAPTLQAGGITRNTYLYVDTVNVNSAESVQLSWTVPSEGRSGKWWIARVHIRTTGSQTVHDIHADGEFVSMRVFSYNSSNLAGSVNNRVHYYYAGTGTAPFGWSATFERPFPELRVQPGDVLYFEMPPVDDGGAPTGDLQAYITLIPC